MRTLVVLLLACTLAFAGCASSPSTDPESSSSSTSSSTGKTTTGTGSSTSSTSTSGPGATPNRAPVITITLAQGQSANGSAPLALTFVLNGTDADGDALSWTLSFDDGTDNATGASLPAEHNHTFAEVGQYNVTFQVTDGLSTTNATYPIDVLASGGGQSLPPIVITGSWDLGVPDGNYYEFFSCTAGPGDGITTAAFTIPAEAAGRAFTATISGTGPIVGWVVALSNTACGTGDDEYEDFTVDGAGPISGTILEGWTFGSFASQGGASLTVTMTIV